MTYFIIFFTFNGHGKLLLLQWRGKVSKVEEEYFLNKWADTMKSFSFYSPNSNSIGILMYDAARWLIPQNRLLFEMTDIRFWPIPRSHSSFLSLQMNSAMQIACVELPVRLGALCQCYHLNPSPQIKDLLLWLSFCSLITV